MVYIVTSGATFLIFVTIMLSLILWCGHRKHNHRHVFTANRSSNSEPIYAEVYDVTMLPSVNTIHQNTDNITLEKNSCYGNSESITTRKCAAYHTVNIQHNHD